MFALTKDEIDSVSRFAFDGSGLVISDSGFQGAVWQALSSIHH
jgi:hypothetical protein